ncbi:ADCYA cyclase, partial [Acromyrmex charruanus]
MAHKRRRNEKSIATVWTPDLFGPVYKKKILTVKQALHLRNVNEQIHRMATFVPDQIIYENLSEKSLQSFKAVLMILNISDFSTIFNNFFHDKNGGCMALTNTLNDYIRVVVREVYCSKGDILKFSAEGILTAWKVHDGKFTYDIVQNVIARAISIQNSIGGLKDINANMAISAGDVKFSVIGDDKARHFVICGVPIEELKNAKKISLPNDLILSLSAWQHCQPSQYEYVIKNPYNIKIIRVLKSDITSTYMAPILPNNRDDPDYEPSMEEKLIINDIRLSTLYRTHLVSINVESETEITKPKSTTECVKNNIKYFHFILIEKGESLRFLAEIRRITIISINIVPNECSDNELILLIDNCFLLLHSIVTQYGGCINIMNLYEKNIFFCIGFGIRGCNNENQFKIDETCKNGIICATQILQTLQTIVGIQSIFIGVSTGIAYCGVIGHIARRYYAIIGPPIDKATNIMNISCNKVSCDYDTMLHSHFRKNQFRCGGIKILQLEKYHIFEYLGDVPKQKDEALSLEYGYPILGRLQELEHFNEILDNIGIADRKYSGLLIEGIERSGKSRLLDAFVMSVCNRQIKPIKLSLHETYAEKSYSVIYHIILQLKSKICILLDDIQYLDHRSWQFLSSALDNCNIVIAMTILKHHSWEYLSHVEAEIYKDKRLTNHNLLGLDVELLPVFACQFLNVLAIPTKLSRILEKCQDGHLGWCEALLTLILQSNGLNFIQISPSKALEQDLVFPSGSLVTKLPIDLTPEELAPPLSWLQRDLLDVCVINENFVKITNKNRDITGKSNILLILSSEIYNRMNLYEQDFIKCAATLGRVFKRSMIENVMLNAIPPHTIKTISEMIRIRILECASLQRRNFYTQDLTFCIDKKRQTFSNMHHLLDCNCLDSQVIVSRYLMPLHGHCKMLEFKVNAFHQMMYNIQTNEERQEYHTRAAKICEPDARKCNSCGRGRFLKILHEDVFKELKEQISKPKIALVRLRTLIEDKWMKPMTILPESTIQTISAKKKNNSVNICRISIMPSDIDDEETEVIFKNEDKNKHDRINIIFKRRSSIFPEMTTDPSDPSLLEKFNHIDYRNCRCNNIISYLFWKLHEHIEKSGKIDKLVEFFIQYSAGMIQIAQPLYAIKLLSIAAERSKAVEVNESIDKNTEDNNKGIILALMGDAHNALGNYDQAKKYYLLAVKLRGGIPFKKKGICQNIMIKTFCKLRDLPDNYTFDEESSELVIKKLELASYLRRLCVGFIRENKLKKAQLFALRSFKLAFLNFNSFLEKGEIYLATIRVLHCTRSIKLIQRIDRLMLITIQRKDIWNDVEEVTMVANIYLTMYQFRVLRGKLEKAVLIGIKVLKISATLHLKKLMLIIMPSIIQIMLWTRRVNEAVDLMRELYFLADEDIDLSAKTWYYALSLDLMLDAGIVLELYETSYNYYVKFIGNNCNALKLINNYLFIIFYRGSSRTQFRVCRDPQSLCHLLTGLWIYQLRMNQTVPSAFTCSAEKYVEDVTWDDFSRILTCSKIQLNDENKNKLYLFITALLIYITWKNYFVSMQCFSVFFTWKEKLYDSMARYWLEYINSTDIVPWQYVRNFNVDTWSTILYPLPMPDAHS